MTSAPKRADPLAGWCCAVPHGGADVCPVCRGPRRDGYATCYACDRVMDQVSHPCRRVVPVSLYELGSPLHRALRSYKDGGTAGIRRRYAAIAVTLLVRFVSDHADCLGGTWAGLGGLGGSLRPGGLGGSLGPGGIRGSLGADRLEVPWDLVTTVPSTSGRTPHPLEEALRLDAWLGAQHRTTLVRGGERLDHLRASDAAFSIASGVDVAGKRVIVLDDTYTSGARAQSAASALALAGAAVLAVVPVGRVVNPTVMAWVAAWWRSQTHLPYASGTCCLEPRSLCTRRRRPAHACAGRQGCTGRTDRAGEAGIAY